MWKSKKIVKKSRDPEGPRLILAIMLNADQKPKSILAPPCVSPEPLLSFG